MEDRDLALALRLQAEYEREVAGGGGSQQRQEEEDSLALARRLQAECDGSAASEEMAPFLPARYRTPHKTGPKLSCVDQEWETIDPTPDLHALFLEFNQTFFWGRLAQCEVKWSPRMFQCAGICRYSPRERFCTIGISIPLLKLRPRKDLVETLLHEMIHAYLFVTDNNRDRDGHGPEFHKHMYRINAATGASISVYHTFHDEVELYKTHWWRCDGPCTKKPPFYGFVKRTMNRAPGAQDRWWGQHQATCGGNFIKVKEPEGFGQKKGNKSKGSTPKLPETGPDIRKFFGGSANRSSGANQGKALGGGVTQPSVGGKKDRMPRSLLDANEVRSKIPFSSGSDRNSGGGFLGGKGGRENSGGGFLGGRGGRESSSSVGGRGGRESSSSVGGGGGRGNIFGFGGTSFAGPGGGGGAVRGRGAGTVVVRPGTRGPPDNSSGGGPVETRYGGAAVSTGGGVRLGSTDRTGGSAASSSSAREAVRQRWAGQSSPPNKTKNNSKTVSNPGTGENNGIQTVKCPICNKEQSEVDINKHLDTCLGTEKQDNTDDLFDDDDDDVLLAAAVGHENSRIVISDSDDDEPLIKRRPTITTSEAVSDVINDTTSQDDEDILAALGDMNKENVDESMFACPVCDKFVSHGDMNNHLDECAITM